MTGDFELAWCGRRGRLGCQLPGGAQQVGGLGLAVGVQPSVDGKRCGARVLLELAPVAGIVGLALGMQRALVQEREAGAGGSDLAGGLCRRIHRGEVVLVRRVQPVAQRVRPRLDVRLDGFEQLAGCLSHCHLHAAAPRLDGLELGERLVFGFGGIVGRLAFERQVAHPFGVLLARLGHVALGLADLLVQLLQLGSDVGELGLGAVDGLGRAGRERKAVDGSFRAASFSVAVRCRSSSGRAIRTMRPQRADASAPDSTQRRIVRVLTPATSAAC